MKKPHNMKLLSRDELWRSITMYATLWIIWTNIRNVKWIAYAVDLDVEENSLLLLLASGLKLTFSGEEDKESER